MFLGLLLDCNLEKPPKAATPNLWHLSSTALTDLWANLQALWLAVQSPWSQDISFLFLVIPPIFSVSSETLIVLRFILNLQPTSPDSSSVEENTQFALLQPSEWSQMSTFLQNLNSNSCAVTRLHYDSLFTNYTDTPQFHIFKCLQSSDIFSYRIMTTMMG